MAGNEISAMGWQRPAAGLEGVGNFHIAIINTEEPRLKKPEENQLSNANLPGGIFTHPKLS